MTIGPWTENAMWTPDEEKASEPQVVREHYFQVVAEVREDGTFTFRVGELDSINLVYLVDKDEWVRVSETEEIETSDVSITFALERRLA